MALTYESYTPDVLQHVVITPVGTDPEEVAAAAVLREGMEATQAEIRAFASERLADFKVPRKVVLLDELPKGATGKIQRIGMAEKLGLVEQAA